MTALAFELRPALEAHEPPEARGLARDEVRLLVARRGERSISHHSFSELPELLEPGDVVVINISATIPAALPATASDGTAVRVHFATRAPQLDDDWRVVEIRSADGSTPHRLGAGERLELRGGAALDLIAPYASGQRLMLARFCCALLVDEYLEQQRRADPLLPRERAVAARGLSERVRGQPGQRRDAERRPADHPRADLPPGRARDRGRADHAALRRVLPREPRAAVPRVVRGARADGASGSRRRAAAAAV